MVSSLINLFVFSYFFTRGFGMNDAFLYGSIVCCGLLAVLAFASFHTYSGVKDNLENARVGSVYNFQYLQPVTDEPDRFCAKVVAIQKFTKSDLERMNQAYRYRRNDSNFIRSGNLVTAQTPDGKIRNFYTGRTQNVRRPFLGKVLFSTGAASFLM